ncbi:elongation of very long chain fatty acids protein 7-like [Daktulosphaira vitifoliae]|uniref:elongation of very long chain fatty acids protein 7-like n=1 Tax=Daktulosphaira vitifoliae TaxID=58002 RepID=UPI0021AA37FF|nr:elongation of very long chain fatty acids protein 7-like [Daktulosphaira vitifoliae]XP_050521965.1 elongation of very long chain fatty acids protein 7-like [Daktulosphaira vitifoliae]
MPCVMFESINHFNKWLYENGDRRMEEYWLYASIWPIISIIFVYLLFVLKLGPSYMKNRKPFDIDRIVMIYNIFQVFYSMYIVKESVRLIWSKPDTYRLNCIEVDYSNTETSRDKIFIIYLYYFSKILDLLDTVFFVLRKKQSQVTFLHVYHHGMMVTAGWLVIKFYPGGQLAFLGSINSVVHTIMYSYYFLTVLKPEYKKAWWKKYLTQLQLIQFVLTALHGVASLLATDCTYPKFIMAFALPQDILMFYLFWNFYKKAYTSKNKQS